MFLGLAVQGKVHGVGDEPVGAGREEEVVDVLPVAIHGCLFVRALLRLGRALTLGRYAEPALRAGFHVRPEVCHVELLEFGGEILFVQVLTVVLQEHMDVHDVPNAAAADLEVAVEVGQQEEVIVVPGEVVEVCGVLVG